MESPMCIYTDKTRRPRRCYTPFSQVKNFLMPPAFVPGAKLGGWQWLVGKRWDVNVVKRLVIYEWSISNRHWCILVDISHRIHGAAIYGNMDPINIPQMLAYIPYMDPMGMWMLYDVLTHGTIKHLP